MFLPSGINRLETSESLDDPSIALLVTISVGAAMVRAFAIAMSVAALATMLGALTMNSDECSKDDFAIVAKVDADFEHDFSQQFANELNDSSPSTALPEPFIPEVIVQAPTLDLARQSQGTESTSECFADILECKSPKKENTVIGRTVTSNHDYRPNLLIIDGKPREPRGFLRGMTPDELQFGCVRRSNQTERLLSQALLHGTPEVRLDAAQQLWRGHSRYYADYVLKYALDEQHSENKAFRAEVTAALSPAALAKEITDGDCEWGAWLATLRPHEDVVPVLIECLKTKPQENHAELMFALGKSRDARAFGPLLEVLQKNEYGASGYAALALGYLGRLEAEAPLISAVERGGPFPVMHACNALSKLGSRNALPCLINLVETGRLDGGAIDVSGCARDAIKEIEAREP
jgi:hypothetical protein